MSAQPETTYRPTPMGVTAPSEAAIDGLEFIDAPELARLADDLIERHNRFTAHNGLRIAYLWKAKGGKSNGSVTLGKCQKPSGLLAYYSDVDFVIWIAADHAREMMLTPKQIEGVLFHELCHIGFNDKAEPELRNHDWAGFVAEIETYGLYLDDMRRVGKAVRQTSLFESNGGAE